MIERYTHHYHCIATLITIMTIIMTMPWPLGLALRPVYLYYNVSSESEGWETPNYKMRRVSVALIAGVLESTVYTPYTVYYIYAMQVTPTDQKPPFLLRPCFEIIITKPPRNWNIPFFIFPPKVKVWLLCAFPLWYSSALGLLLHACFLTPQDLERSAFYIQNGWIHHSSRSSQGLLKLLGSSTQLFKVKTYCLPLSALKAVDAFKQVSEAVAEVPIWSLQQLAETRIGRGLLWLWVFSFYAQARRKALTAECLCRCIL